MGDRRMAEIKTLDGSLYVYTHWNGSVFPEMAREAIKAAKSRWDDTPYALRIIADQLTKGERDLTTGSGLLLIPNAEDSYNHDTPSILIDLIKRTLIVIEDRIGVTTPFDQL